MFSNAAVTQYLGPLTCVADVSCQRTRRSAATNHLIVPSFKLPTIGSRAFPLAADAKIRNALTNSVVAASSVNSFQHQMKTFLFQRYFCC